MFQSETLSRAGYYDFHIPFHILFMYPGIGGMHGWLVRRRRFRKSQHCNAKREMEGAGHLFIGGHDGPPGDRTLA
jgi:hypothetical protein